MPIGNTSQTFKDNGSAVVIGVGDRNGVGGAVSVLAGRQGLHVFAVGRTQAKVDKIAAEIESAGGSATAVAIDCESPDGVTSLFEQVAAHGKPLRLAVHNMAAPNLPTAFLRADADFIETHWRRSCFAGFLLGQAALRQMLDQADTERGRGTIIFTGASGSLRGKAQFAAFASAKASLRAMAQSMAREFGPQGIHIGHTVIDGIIDGQFVRNAGGNLARMWLKSKGEDGALKPDEIAKAYWLLHSQTRTAWTHEIDLRPFRESF